MYIFRNYLQKKNKKGAAFFLNFYSFVSMLKTVPFGHI